MYWKMASPVFLRYLARMPPDQSGLDCLEKRLDGGVVIAVALATHRYLKAVLTQELLIIMGEILAAAIAVEDAALGWRSEGDGHFQGPDRQIPPHTIADSPADHAAGMQV